MRESVTPALSGKLILIVEDEYVLASELAKFFEEQGASVAGPAGTLKSAMALVAREGSRLSVATLDINLRGERVYPVADALIQLRVPIIFTTGYDELLMATPYNQLPRCPKPVDKALLSSLVGAAIANGSGA